MVKGDESNGPGYKSAGMEPLFVYALSKVIVLLD